MKTSQKGIDLIKKWEGFRSRPYICQAGYLTIGYGHVIKKGQTLEEVTPEIAEQMLRIDISTAEKSVRRLINPEVFKGAGGQDRFDALVSFTYNLGGGALQRSTLRAKINRGEELSVFNEFGKYRLAGGKVSKGLVARRWDEAALYLGSYTE